jgi:DNA-binding transcriptional regulator LsrR (DeoR family)
MKAPKSNREWIKYLQNMGFNQSDIAGILNISRQRVSQLLQAPKKRAARTTSRATLNLVSRP